MTRIILLDDHALFRFGLAAILRKEAGFEIVGEYKSFSSLKSLIPNLEAEVLFVDISLEEESGLDVAKYVKSVNPGLKVIILSSHKAEFYIVNALKAGVDGYIHKDVNPMELINGVKKVLKGEKFYSLEISNLLINNVYNKPKGGSPFLTLKEKEVLQYLLEGFSSKKIAEKLDISPRTIETHRANILNKFKLKNTTELITKVMGQKAKS